MSNQVLLESEIEQEPKKAVKEQAFSNISVRSFVMIAILLSVVLVISGALSYFVPQGSFDRVLNEDGNEVLVPGSYVSSGEAVGIAPWKVLTAPVRVFFSEDALTISMICIFLLVMSGVFNILEKTEGVRVVIGRIMSHLKNKGGPVICFTVLLFMLFGSFFGMYEELVTLLPIIIMFMLSMGMDTMMGLGACLLAACFGFSAAITNPFSVGLAAGIAGIAALDGVWLRFVFFAVTYVLLCTFLMVHLRRIQKNPMASPSYAVDVMKRATMETPTSQENNPKETRIFRVYGIFFAVQMVMLVLIASIRAISDYAIPLLSVSFLVGGLICGCLVSEKKGKVFRYLGQGALAMAPAVVMIAIASSVKLVMAESGIIDTIMNYVIEALEGKSKFFCIVLIYLLILFLQVFIGSASAKIMLVMPIMFPICQGLGLSPTVVILAYCMADGFTDVILPTNPILLVALSMANVSYGKWVKWTWKLQLGVLGMTLLTLLFAVGIGY